MSNKHHYQVQYVQKDNTAKVEYKNDSRAQYKPKKACVRRNSNTIEIDKNVHRELVYDSASMIAAYKLQSQPPQEIQDLMKRVPYFFSNTSKGPAGNETYKTSDEEPDWMQACETEFSLKDIESEIEAKRVEYQKSHGLEKRKPIEDKVSTLEREKQKYREQRDKQHQEQQTQMQLQQLFNMQNTPLEDLKVMTVEEVEKSAGVTVKDQQMTSSVSQLFQQIQMQQGVKEEPKIIIDDDSEFDLDALLGINIQPYVLEPPPNQRIISLEQIKNSPFSTQAKLHSKEATDKLWFYIDKKLKVQGGFPSKDMDQWYAHGYFMPELRLSWGQPGNWVVLEQFLKNLEQVSQGNIPKQKAMEYASVSDDSTMTSYGSVQNQSYQQPYQQYQQQPQQQQYSNQRYQQRNNYHGNNSTYVQYQPQQYQYTQPKKKVPNNQNNPIFNIGNQKHQVEKQTSGQEGVNLNSKDFPQLLK